jgi:branched-chain amino acid aminotransferase
MGVARFADGVWSPASVVPTEPLSLHPATHALHYGSSCFEGLKAHRGTDGSIRIFRLADHAARMQQSASTLGLPVPGDTLLTDMIVATVAANSAVVPDAPGSLYLRPMLLGTDLNIGSATKPSASALLCVVASPVGEYFSGSLSMVVETGLLRTTPQFGKVKSGANYAMALPVLRAAKQQHGADQVIFSYEGVVQEASAANVIMIRPDRVTTPALTDAFLHGVTRDSVLRLAHDLGYTVDEHHVTVDELMAWMPRGEVALSGTAAILTPVERLLRSDTLATSSGHDFGHTEKLCSALRAIQIGESEDRHGWLTDVGGAS